MAYQKKEAWDKVASTLARATQVAPKFANYWYQRGYALEEQAEKKTISWEEAKEPFKKCIESDPNFADCYHELGLRLPLDRRRAEALSNYTKAIEHNPTSFATTPASPISTSTSATPMRPQQVLKEARVRQAKARRRSSACTSCCRRSTRTRGR